MPDGPWLPPLAPFDPLEASVVGVVPPEAVVPPVALGLLDLAPVLVARVLVVAGSGPGVAFAEVGVTDEAAGVAAVVVGVGPSAAWAGGTSVEALQIWAYEGATEGGGSLGFAGSSLWNIKPSTSSAGLETDCSAGPLDAYTQDPDAPCQ
jgi:hypothetical protein